MIMAMTIYRFTGGYFHGYDNTFNADILPLKNSKGENYTDGFRKQCGF